MIAIIPYQRFAFSTSLTPAEAANLISNSIATYHWWSILADHGEREFMGKVSGRGFQLYKLIHYRNSFLPVLYGRFSPTAEGTRIDVVMTLGEFTWAFCAVWIAGTSAVFLRLLMEAMSTGIWSWYVLIPVAAIAFLWFVVMISFGFYAQTTVDFITNLFAQRTGEQWRFWAWPDNS